MPSARTIDSSLGPLFRGVLANGERGGEFPTACLTGPQTRPVVIEAPDAHCCVLGIRLTPVGAYRVLATPLHHTADLTLDLSDVVDRSLEELALARRDAATVRARFSRVIARCATTRACRALALCSCSARLQGRAAVSQLAKSARIGLSDFFPRRRRPASAGCRHH